MDSYLSRIVDLGDLFGPITFLKNLNQTYFEFETGNETFSLVGEKGIWGHSLVLLGPAGQKSCGTISVTDEYEERVAEAKFWYPISGSVYFRWAGSYKHNVTDNVIFSNLVHVTNNSASNHDWKIYVTDILDSEADKSRRNCDFLQIVLNPGNSNTVAGDLTSRLGKVSIADLANRHTAASRSIFRDQGLSALPADLLSGSRSLYLVIFDSRHRDSFFACSKIRYHNHIALKAIIQQRGISGFVSLSQRTRFDPTWLLFNISSVTKQDLFAIECQVNEFPVDHSLRDGCSQTGNLYNPTGISSNNIGSLDVYPVGALSLKHEFPNYMDFILTMRNESGKNIPWVCGTLLRYKSSSFNSQAVQMSTASVVFRYPIVSSIIFRQPRDQPWMDTTVLIEYMIHADGTTMNNTFEHRWSINENPPGKDFYNWTGRCLSAGGIYNPFKINLNSNKLDIQCSRNNHFSCLMGDLFGKLGFLAIAGSKDSRKISRKLFTVETLPLMGGNSIIGKSVVIYDDFGPTARGDRLACSRILPVHRRKAVVKTWHNNGEPASVSGKFEFLQQTKYDVTNIDISIEGLVDTRGYHIHVAPVQEQLEFPCEDSTVYGHFNPRLVNPNTSPKIGTPDQYEVGDLSGKFGTFENKTTVVAYYNDTQITLFGSESILGRSIVIHKRIKNRRWVCSSIERGYSPFEARELRAIASFHHPGGFASGYIRITQLVYNDGSKSDSVIEVNLRYPGKQDRNLTQNHNWAIFVNPVSVDASVKVISTRCTAGGYVWNPYYTQLADPLNEELYKKECGPDNPLRCYVGDISGRLGTINLGDKRQVFSDVNFPLEGDVSAMGRSIVIFSPEKGGNRFACANIEPDKDIIKYVNIRRTPRFVASLFLEEVREIMGVPEWFLTVDSMKTKILYNGNCIQFLIHFKGPEANKLEHDFSILMATGRLYSPSLYIPGYNPSSKRKTTISHAPCGSDDPQDKMKKKKKSNFKNTSGTYKHELVLSCIEGTIMEEHYVTEIPSSLKQLARLVVRGFYNIEDALIVDMLVRNPCMKEDDICELLKFERKMLRSKIATLKNDKFIQVRLKMETGLDGKAQKTFVNVVKYKLDLMRKRMETEERDATSRASFKCPNCLKTFTDLEADQLYEMMSQQFLCTHCKQEVEEDQSAMPKKDSRLLLAKFNEQLEPLFVLLRQVEGIKLAPELLEPEPVDISAIKGSDKKSNQIIRTGNEQWSGELTRNQGFRVEETRVNVTIAEETIQSQSARKERPVWMTQSTIINQDIVDNKTDLTLSTPTLVETNEKMVNKTGEDIMSVLLQHEKRDQNAADAVKAVMKNQTNSDSSDDESKTFDPDAREVETISSDDEDSAPVVMVGGKPIPVTQVDDRIIAQMTPSEKEAYIQTYQECYSNLYD
ncbi:hypothetical protein RUM43_012900 [Polyplax serrata]|uniref:General transcription factor IIE subunit 1 n=1 Tax=Polyplax serrata TaxID=468196 RepID=A0AAN8NYN2_POLSC